MNDYKVLKTYTFRDGQGQECIVECRAKVVVNKTQKGEEELVSPYTDLITYDGEILMRLEPGVYQTASGVVLYSDDPELN